MKVKFENGYIAEVNDEIAKRMIKKGECKAVKTPKDIAKEEAAAKKKSEAEAKKKAEAEAKAKAEAEAKKESDK